MLAPRKKVLLNITASPETLKTMGAQELLPKSQEVLAHEFQILFQEEYARKWKYIIVFPLVIS